MPAATGAAHVVQRRGQRPSASLPGGPGLLGASTHTSGSGRQNDVDTHCSVPREEVGGTTERIPSCKPQGGWGRPSKARLEVTPQGQWPWPPPPAEDMDGLAAAPLPKPPLLVSVLHLPLPSIAACGSRSIDWHLRETLGPAPRGESQWVGC